MRIYLDNCCLNRPFDNQSGIRVKLETDAKLHIQFLIREQKIDLAWSYILDFENEANPFVERKLAIAKWKVIAAIDIEENDSILSNAVRFAEIGLKPKDALHLACALESKCTYLLTTDDLFIKKSENILDISVLNPVDFIKII
jgi:predicted nucleic acid-binding protein